MQYQIPTYSAPIGGAAAGALALALLGGCAFGHEHEADDLFEASVAAAMEMRHDVAESANDEVDQPEDHDGAKVASDDEIAVNDDTNGDTNNQAIAANDNDTVPAVPLGKPKGTYQLTYYWMAAEGDSPAPRNITLYASNCKPLAKITAEYAKRLLVEGTGRLRNGRTVNVAGACDCPLSPCFFVVGQDKKWGVGVRYRALSPFRSVAVDPTMVAIGQLLYLPELDGLTMPGVQPWGGFVHDGCVMADDLGGGIKDKQLDFFMGQYNFYDGFFKRHRIQSVTVYDGKTRCKNVGGKVVAVNRNSI